jgi:folate-binding Fe-S cluster repair protein YgfZ
MINLDKLGGVSFKKGCYPGQEIVARTHYLGKIKRHLYRLSSEQPLVSGTEVRSAVLNGQACGSLLMVAPGLDGNWLALAVLQQDATEGALYLQTEAGEQTLTLIDLVLPEAAE